MANDDLKHIDEQQTPETPIIIIERDEEDVKPVTHSEEQQRKRLPRWLKWLCLLAAVFAMLAIVAAGYHNWRYYYRLGVPVSKSPNENITLLQTPPEHTLPPAVVMQHDSILGVALNLYELQGLTGEITLDEPDTTDTSVYLYSRCSDHTPDGKYLGSMVMQGKEMSSDVTRLGYCAMNKGRTVIGISRFETVKDYIVEQGGSYFRQFILVSDGVLPPRFHLHGKVERRGLGRIGDKIYYVETCHPETMWDFADALREYGFIDAIYITGGNEHQTFYRTADGIAYPIGTANDSIQHQPQSAQIPWLVFKKP